MSVEVMEITSLILFILSGVTFAAGIVIFFVLKIPLVYGELSGQYAKKAILEYTLKNAEENEEKTSGKLPKTRSTITGKMTKGGRVAPRSDGFDAGIRTQKLKQYMRPSNAAETTVLRGGFSTETEILNKAPYVASADVRADSTTVLPPAAKQKSNTSELKSMELIYEDMFMVSQEIIE